MFLTRLNQDSSNLELNSQVWYGHLVVGLQTANEKSPSALIQGQLRGPLDITWRLQGCQIGRFPAQSDAMSRGVIDKQ